MSQEGIILGLIKESPIATITTLITVFLTYRFIVYPLFVNPLRSIPGPYLYKTSSIFTLNDQRTEKRNVKLDRLHQKYGSVVQISPNEVSLSSLSHLKKIYLKDNLPKSSFYAQFTNFGSMNAFSTLETTPHIQRKKLMAKLYSKSSVFSATSQTHINSKVNNVLKFITSTEGQSIDVYELFNSLAMDVVTFYEFGSKFATNLILDVEQREIIKAFRASSSMWFYTTLFPSMWDFAASKETKKLSDGCREWIRAKFLEAYDDLEENGNDDEVCVMRTLYHSGIDKYGIGSELFDHTAAGHETTGTSLAYCTWELSRPFNHHIQEEIAIEMEKNFGKNGEHIGLEKLDKLLYLDAVILETTRLHAAIPGSEPRVVHSSREFKVELANGSEIILPQGTIVSVQPYTIHRDPQVFADPDQFIPERWLQSSDETGAEFNQRFKLMKSMIFAFGQGNRMCLGMNVAVMEMKLCIGKLYQEFKSKISDDWCKNISGDRVNSIMGYESFKDKSKTELTDVELMSMADSYTSRPYFDECWLVWENRR